MKGPQGRRYEKQKQIEGAHESPMKRAEVRQLEDEIEKLREELRQDAKAVAFRDWLDDLGGTAEKLPDGSFKSSFRPTGVATRVVVLDKPAAAQGKNAVDHSSRFAPEHPDETEAVAEEALTQHGQAAPDAGAAAVPQQAHASLEAAVAWCFEQAHAGDAVLLSPACASLDMFRNYGHRAAVFVAAVQALAADRGEALA